MVLFIFLIIHSPFIFCLNGERRSARRARQIETVLFGNAIVGGRAAGAQDRFGGGGLVDAVFVQQRRIEVHRHHFAQYQPVSTCSPAAVCS